MTLLLEEAILCLAQICQAYEVSLFDSLVFAAHGTLRDVFLCTYNANRVPDQKPAIQPIFTQRFNQVARFVCNYSIAASIK